MTGNHHIAAIESD